MELLKVPEIIVRGGARGGGLRAPPDELFCSAGGGRAMAVRDSLTGFFLRGAGSAAAGAAVVARGSAVAACSFAAWATCQPLPDLLSPPLPCLECTDLPLILGIFWNGPRVAGACYVRGFGIPALGATQGVPGLLEETT